MTPTPPGKGEPWYRDGLRFECSMCGNCCTGPEGVVLFSPEEGQAMADKVGLPLEEFLARYARKVGRQRSLREKQTEFGNDCIFLDRNSIPGKAVCGLYEARPEQCRTWPFWEGNLRSRKAWEETKKHVPCPGMDKGPLHDLVTIRIAVERDKAGGGSWGPVSGAARDPFAALPPDAADLAARWAEAAFSPSVDAELRAIHADMAAATAALGPRCDASGRCCRFGEWGHRLFVTGLEAAWCLRAAARTPSAEEVRAAATRDDCPFLSGGRCGVHAFRPIGCRAYFCDPKAAGWQEELSERMLARLRALHEAHGIPYRYGEWRTMLAHFAA